MMNHKRCG